MSDATRRGATGASAAASAATLETLAPGPDRESLARNQRRFGAWYATEGALGALRRFWWTMLLQGIGAPILYVLAFGVGLAVLMQARGTNVDGVDYLTFVGPALLLNGVFQTAFMEGSFPVFGGFKWRGTFFIGANAGLTPSQQALGVLNFALLRTIPTALIFLAVLAIAGGVPSWNALWLVPISVLLAASAALPAMAFAARLRDDRGEWNMVNRFIIIPLMLFSGTYYPLDVLPAGLQWIGWISPLWHSVDLARIASYGLERPVWLVAVHIAVIAAYAGVGWLLARRYFTRRLDQ